LQSIDLSKNLLKVRRPLLFYSKEYFLPEIQKIDIRKANISFPLDGSTFDFYKGENLIIKFKDNRSIKIGSLEVSNYDNFKKKLISLKSH
jgi:hypothetical protein